MWTLLCPPQYSYLSIITRAHSYSFSVWFCQSKTSYSTSMKDNILCIPCHPEPVLHCRKFWTDIYLSFCLLVLSYLSYGSFQSPGINYNCFQFSYFKSYFPIFICQLISSFPQWSNNLSFSPLPLFLSPGKTKMLKQVKSKSQLTHSVVWKQ